MTPPDLPVTLRLSLRAGTVYYFDHRRLSSVEPLFFVVINADPQSGNVLIMTVGSSQIVKTQERRKDFPSETLVIVDPVEYSDFSKQTIVDCNQVFELSKEELIQKFNARELRYHKDLPEKILKRIWRGVRLSPRVDEIHKNLIPPEDIQNKLGPPLA
ncbi:MAG: hypothetical protein ACOYOU_04615 [Kiritimatiellia bacterium]